MTMNSRYDAVSNRIAQAALSAGRSADSVTLVAVSKTQPAGNIRLLYQLGQRDFGENYLQEALEKQEALSDLDAIIWHFIGPIQSNKTRALAEHFDWVHSVDRLRIAERLSAQRPASRPPLNICLQINISHEDSKSGAPPEEAEKLADAISQLPGLRLRGLMAIPEASEDPQQQAAAFLEMKRLMETLQCRIPDLDTLSMGMSGDLEQAIKAGATHVRIGTALFGSRHQPLNNGDQHEQP